MSLPRTISRLEMVGRGTALSIKDEKIQAFERGGYYHDSLRMVTQDSKRWNARILNRWDESKWVKLKTF